MAFLFTVYFLWSASVRGVFLFGDPYGIRNVNVIEKFRPIGKKSLTQFINEMMNDKIKSALSVEEQAPVPQAETIEIVEPFPKIVTTQDKLEAYFYIKTLSKGIVRATQWTN